MLGIAAAAVLLGTVPQLAARTRVRCLGSCASRSLERDTSDVVAAPTQRHRETTELPVEAVARHVGLGSAVNLRRRFARVVGTSPSAYRRAFASKR